MRKLLKIACIFFVSTSLVLVNDKDCRLALWEAGDVSILAETEDKAVILIEHEEKSYGNKIMIILKDCFPKTGNHRVDGKGKVVEKIRSSYHEDTNEVRVVADFYKKPKNHEIARAGNGTRMTVSSFLTEYESRAFHKKPPYSFRGRHGRIPEKIKSKMKRYSWHPACPVQIYDLSYLTVSYWGYDAGPHSGELVVHKKIAPETLGIFEELFERKFPIERMRLVDEYKGSDDDSMAANNSSAFNCRMSAANQNVFSKHSYGLAIDINPLVNPYVKNGIVLPPDGKEYLDRKRHVKGMIVKGGDCYKAFVRRGWKWGGEWKTLKDYQHFEKKIDLSSE